MFKRITIIVLCLILSLSALVSCTLVTDNSEKNSRQIIAKILAINESGNDRHKRTDDGYFVYTLSNEYLARIGEMDESDRPDYTEDTLFYVKNENVFTLEEWGYEFCYDVQFSDLIKKTENWTFSTKEQNIYKYQLYSYINSYGASYVNNYGYSLKEAVEYFVDQLLLRQIAITETDKLVARGEIELGLAYENEVIKNIYSTIDSQYNSYLADILTEQGKEVPETLADETSTEPTYPSYPYGDVVTEGEVEVWDVNDPKNMAKWPGMSGSVEVKSRELEAMKRFVNGLKQAIRDDIRLTKDERKETDKEFEKIDAIISTQGMEKVYPMLGKTFIIEHLIGKSIKEDAKITRLQNYINGDIEATEDEILKEFNRTIINQTELYSEDIENYYAASGEKLVLVNPDPHKNIYVKHILIQFSDEQKAQLDAYKNSFGTNSTGYLNLRNRLAKEIIGYEHVDGEDDLTRPIPISTISTIIRSQVSAAGSDARQALRNFDKLMYKYNQDPGIFDSSLGYSISRVLGEGETDTYVAEFAAGARKLAENCNVGDLLDYDIVSDFGVHFMIYYYDRPSIPASQISIKDPVTKAGYETYYDLVKEIVLSNKSESLFNDWQSQVLDEYKDIDKNISIYSKRFKDIYKQR